MKKITFILAIILAAAFIFTACSSSTNAIKEELCGAWGYALGGSDGQFYIFSYDNIVECVFVNGDGYSPSHKASYKIKKNEIIIKNDTTGDIETIIEYTFNNGVLVMVDKDADGFGNHEMVKVQ